MTCSLPSAASRRLGWTSFASIEPERSSTSISDASRTGPAWSRAGARARSRAPRPRRALPRPASAGASLGLILSARHNSRHRRKPHREPACASPSQPLQFKRDRHQQQREQPQGGVEAHSWTRPRFRDDNPARASDQSSSVLTGTCGHASAAGRRRARHGRASSSSIALAAAPTTCRPRRDAALGSTSAIRPTKESVASRGSHTSTAKAHRARRPPSAA